MWYTIKEGRHRASPLSLGLHLGREEDTYEVMFDESCRYDLGDIDQLDYNKLFGWSYGMHHNNSIRVGWRYNLYQEQIELVLYMYKDGQRVDMEYLHTVFVPLNTKIKIRLTNAWGKPALAIFSKTYSKYTIDMADYKLIPEYKPTWGYNLGLYFGGDKPAPHDMKVWMRRVS